MQTPPNATQPSPSWPDTPARLEKARANYGRFSDLSMRYRDDASLRARVDGGDTADVVAALGIDVPGDVEVKVVADTAGTMHFVMPPDPNFALSDESLDISAGGKTAGSAGSVGSASSLACSTSPSSLGTASSIASAGTRG